jgi:hypothetical protein
MLAILRAVSATASYREARSRLASRAPDDVWREGEASWVTTFRVNSDGDEQLLVFSLTGVEGPGPAVVRRVVAVHKSGREISARIVWDPASAVTQAGTQLTERGR